MVDKKRDSDKLAKRIGKRIADRRKVLGWTQEQLAERVRVDAETISRFERGVNLPSLPTLERLAAALRVEPGDLLTRAEPEKLKESAAISTLISELSDGDRTFMINQMRNWCEHLRKSARRAM